MKAMEELRAQGKLSDKLSFAEQYKAVEAMFKAQEAQQNLTPTDKLYMVVNENGLQIVGTQQQVDAANATKNDAITADSFLPDAISNTLNGAAITSSVLKNNGYGVKTLLKGADLSELSALNRGKYLIANGGSTILKGSTGAWGKMTSFLGKGSGPAGAVVSSIEDFINAGSALNNGDTKAAGKYAIRATTTGLSTWGFASAGAAWGSCLGPIGTVGGGIVGGLIGFFFGKKTGDVIGDATVGDSKEDEMKAEIKRLGEVKKQGAIAVDPALAQVLTDPITQAYAKQMVEQQNIAMQKNTNGTVGNVNAQTVGTQSNSMAIAQG